MNLYQDAEKRILNGKWAMGNGKTLTICHGPFPISHQAGLFQQPAYQTEPAARPASPLEP
jgi:hypothetical protein